jgi:hypothetical protein
MLSMACSAPGPLPSPVRIELRRAATSPPDMAVAVTGLSSAELTSLRTARLSKEQWNAVFVVEVAANETHVPMLGRYLVLDTAVEFIPPFPFDPGWEYRVRFDPSKLPTPRAEPIIEKIVSLPKRDEAAVAVSAVHPSGGTWPANLLRLYVEFSGPMGRDAGLGHVKILDEQGHEVPDPFLPLEADFWDFPHTRYTVFFDPGRVKEGILPNRQMGRPLIAGRKYALVIDAEWRDSQFRPLKTNYRHEFLAGQAVTQSIALSEWKIAPPAAGSRAPLGITFPRPLDHELLQRTIRVKGPDGRAIAGTIELQADDTHWLFTPSDAWAPGEYQLDVLSILEDPSGNRIDRAFEVDLKRAAPPAPERDHYTLRFAIPPPR